MPPSHRADAIDALRDLNFAADSFRGAVADHYGLGNRESEAVAHLTAHGQLSAGELARTLRLHPATITNLIERLERAGMACRDTDDSDGRRTIVRPTDAAGQLVTEVRGWLSTCLDALSEAGIDEADAVLVLRVVADGLRRRRDELGAAAQLTRG